MQSIELLYDSRYSLYICTEYILMTFCVGGMEVVGGSRSLGAISVHGRLAVAHQLSHDEGA